MIRTRDIPIAPGKWEPGMRVYTELQAEMVRRGVNIRWDGLTDAEYAELGPDEGHELKVQEQDGSGLFNILYRGVTGGIAGAANQLAKPFLGGAMVDQTGEGLLDYVATGTQNAYRKVACGGKARMLLAGEKHLGCHNFTGPGTRIDLAEVQNYKPYNGIDNCSRTHDLDYYNARHLKGADRALAVKKADEVAVACYDRNKNDSGYTAARAGISGKLMVENAYSAIKGKPSVLYGGSGGAYTKRDDNVLLKKPPFTTMPVKDARFSRPIGTF